VVQQIMIIYAVTNGFLDDVPLEKIRGWETGYHSFMAAQHPEIAEEIGTKKALSDDLITRMKAAIGEYKALGPA